MTVLYFAALRDLTGTGEEQLDLPDGVDTIFDLLEQVTRVRASLRDRLQSVRVARNEVFADLSEPVRDGDVVALIPPVQGG